jgi:hypothetical protein
MVQALRNPRSASMDADYQWIIQTELPDVFNHPCQYWF